MKKLILTVSSLTPSYYFYCVDYILVLDTESPWSSRIFDYLLSTFKRCLKTFTSNLQDPWYCFLSSDDFVCALISETVQGQLSHFFALK